MTRRSVLLPLLLLSFAACRAHQEPAPSQTAQVPAPSAPASAAPAAPAAPAGGDSGVGPISSRGEVAEAAAPVAGTKLDFQLPAGWVSEAPSSSMRLAQASIPGPGGPGEMGVFYFGPGHGGGVEDNLSRWVGQMEAGAGTAKPERGTLEANGLKISWIDVHGTLKPSSMGMGPSTPVADARLFGAVVEGTGGPWFFKVTGPDKTLGPQREPFFTMLKGLHPKANA